MKMPQYGYSGVPGGPPPPPTDDDLVNGFLAQAEALYGPRFPGVTFEVQVLPPGGALDTVFDPVANHAIIHRPAGLAEHDRIGQLRQESIHVLSPATPNEAKVFDRGLATLFAVQHNYFPAFNRYDYWAALLAVDWLDRICPDAIRQMRVRQPRVALIGANEITEACNALPPYAAHFLVQPIH